MAKYLSVNLGSASKKYALYEAGRELASAHFEQEGEEIAVSLIYGEASDKVAIGKEDYERAIVYYMEQLRAKNLLDEPNSLGAIGIRVVAPGDYFQYHREIDADYEAKLQMAEGLSPLHILPVIRELELIRRTWPEVKRFAISDSGFHCDMSPLAKIYALPKVLTEAGVRRYGYHGLSLDYATQKIRQDYGDLPGKTIICHLGGGASVTALLDGRVEDTSMGFSPLEGLPMARRAGNVDAQAVLHLIRQGKTAEELERLFNYESGLLGLSGQSADIRELIELENQGDQPASFSLDFYARAVAKYVGSYFVLLGGLDLLVFTGTVGLRSFVMREKICNKLSAIGIVLDGERNRSLVETDGLLSPEGAPVKILALKTDEMSVIARITEQLAGAAS